MRNKEINDTINQGTILDNLKLLITLILKGDY